MAKVKKLLVLNTLLFVLFSIVLLSGCADDSKGLNGVVYNKKYYIANATQSKIDNNEESYIIFKNKNSGVFRGSIINSFQENGMYRSEYKFYTVEFKYTKTDETSVMITIKNQDRVFDDENFTSNDTTIENRLVLVSENVVGISYATSISYYFNIDYLKANNLIK